MAFNDNFFWARLAAALSPHCNNGFGGDAFIIAGPAVYLYIVDYLKSETSK
jgi:hypothetical protein